MQQAMEYVLFGLPAWVIGLTLSAILNLTLVPYVARKDPEISKFYETRKLLAHAYGYVSAFLIGWMTISMIRAGADAIDQIAF